MSKKDFSADAIETISLGNINPTTREEKKPATAKAPKQASPRAAKPDQEAIALERKSYYMTAELHQALKIKAAQDGRDISVLLREAVAAFLAVEAK